MDSKAFAKSFMDWTNAMRTKSAGEFLNIDGKTLRGSKDEGNGKYAIHLVSAWSYQNRLVLGQVKTSGKSNEIEAVKELLTLLDIKGAVITADAMSCQKEIVQQICAKEADYIIAIKDNQKNLKESIEYEFKTQPGILLHETLENDSRKRKDNAAENFAIVRRFALTKITQAPLKRYGINNRRMIASWN